MGCSLVIVFIELIMISKNRHISPHLPFWHADFPKFIEYPVNTGK